MAFWKTQSYGVAKGQEVGQNEDEENEGFCPAVKPFYIRSVY